MKKALKKLLRVTCRNVIPGFKKIERIESSLERVERQILANTCARKTRELTLYFSLLYEVGGASGVCAKRRPPALTVSLTTIPSRLGKVHLAIESLLRQSIQPNRILLWLDHENFGNVNLPVSLQRQVERGLTIRYCDNLFSYKKLIPTLEAFPKDVIVTCDDDTFYPRMWLERLYAAYLEDPGTVHCHRAHRISFNGNELARYQQWEYETDKHEASYLIFPTGVGGILYPPGALHSDVFDRERFLKIAPFGDDIWFKASAVKNGVRAHLIESNAPYNIGEIQDALYVIPGTQNPCLTTSNYFNEENDPQIRNTFEFHQIMDRLRSEGVN